MLSYIDPRKSGTNAGEDAMIYDQHVKCDWNMYVDLTLKANACGNEGS